MPFLLFESCILICASKKVLDGLPWKFISGLRKGGPTRGFNCIFVFSFREIRLKTDIVAGRILLKCHRHQHADRIDERELSISRKRALLSEKFFKRVLVFSKDRRI